jgi:hypothetical protein
MFALNPNPVSDDLFLGQMCLVCKQQGRVDLCSTVQYFYLVWKQLVRKYHQKLADIKNKIYLKVEFITCFGGDSDPEGLNGSARKKKKKKKKRGKKVYREPIGRKLRQSCGQNHKHVFRISVLRIRIFFHP